MKREAKKRIDDSDMVKMDRSMLDCHVSIVYHRSFRHLVYKRERHVHDMITASGLDLWIDVNAGDELWCSIRDGLVRDCTLTDKDNEKRVVGKEMLPVSFIAGKGSGMFTASVNDVFYKPDVPTRCTKEMASGSAALVCKWFR